MKLFHLFKNRSCLFVKLSLSMRGFIQATAIAVYCLLIGALMFNGEKLFGEVSSIVGPALFLVLLVVSVLICGLLAFGAATIIFWDNKDAKSAIRLIAYTAGWLTLYVSVFLNILMFL